MDLEKLDVRCPYCDKKPEEIDEYKPGTLQQAEDGDRAWVVGEFESPAHYVSQEEGTFNPETGHFACTACYILIGMPAKDWPDKWVAP